MSPDDPRHGTYAGYAVHRRAAEPACRPCVTACTEARRKQREFKPRPSRSRAVLEGRPSIDIPIKPFEPDDELTGGRWMWDDRRAIEVFVKTGEVA